MAKNEPPRATYTVSSLTSEIKRTLEGQYRRIYLEGEISGWKRYPSGHCYFTLKDSGAQISAVMFSSSFERCRVRAALKDGTKILAYGTVTIYPPRGNCQISVLAAKLVGEGELMQRYLELKAKLTEEGVFDEAKKRPLPALPRHIGIVTSEAGAVIHDMCNVLFRRFPNLQVRLYPSQVQGVDAPATLIAGIEYFNSLIDANAEWQPELVIIARGGGSFEDLFCFNDEALVRAVASSRAPIISAVGHETDTTLCDHAADRRAGTPSIAAELAVPDLNELLMRIAKAENSARSTLRDRGQYFAQRFDHASGALTSSVSVALLKQDWKINELMPRLRTSFELYFERISARLESATLSLRHLSPYAVLERGYSLSTLDDGSIVRNAAQLTGGMVLHTRFSEGSATSVIASTCVANRPESPAP